MTPQELRLAMRRGEFTGPTSGLVPGYTQTNLVILPKALAPDFHRFCDANAKACPVLEVIPAGVPFTAVMAKNADLRADLPRYWVYRYGRLDAEATNIFPWWREDLVSFLIGCSFTFERALLAEGLPVRHITETKNVPMYITSRQCIPQGRFHGPLVVSMRPIPDELVKKAVAITARYPAVHGAPVDIGDPSELGIADLARPDFGDAVTIYPGEIPVFWACGVTSQAVAMEAKPELMITHAPGHMFITDIQEEDLISALSLTNKMEWGEGY